MSRQVVAATTTGAFKSYFGNATPHTLFDLASVGKQFVAIVVSSLVETKELSFTSSIADFVENAPKSWQHITVEQLLRHTSGLPDYLHGKVNLQAPTTTTECLNRLAKRELRFEPGSRFEYSNSGYMALGHILQKVSGMSAAQYTVGWLEEHGVTGFRPSSSLRDNSYPAGLTYEDGRLSPTTQVEDSWLQMGDAMLAGTAKGVVAWLNAIANGELLKPETWQQIFTPTSGSGIPAYGMGFVIYRQGDMPVVGHAGETDGAFTQVKLDLATEKGYVLLCNTDGEELTDIENELDAELVP